MYPRDGFLSGSFDIGNCQLKQLVRQIMQRPSDRQLVADRGHWFIGWIESRQTNAD